MARSGYTNISPTPERNAMFADVAAAQGMDATVHKHRVEMIDQGLRLLAQKTRRGEMDRALSDAEILAGADHMFAVATVLDYYGPDATEGDVAEYEEFAENYLSYVAGQDVEIYHVEHYLGADREPEGMYDLRQRVWDAFCNSL